MEEKVVLVTENDEVLGLMEKQQAHINGLLHRAFSVFLFNSKGEMLLQKRAAEKYILPINGPMLVAPILERMKPMKKQPKED